MSRTDKDAPAWLRAPFWEPEHHRCPHARLLRRGDRPCDLPEHPVRRRPTRTTWRTAPRRCQWIPRWDTYPPGPRDVPALFVRLQFTGPARRQVRDALTRARQEYRATGHIDTIAPTTQHRHQARRVYW